MAQQRIKATELARLFNSFDRPVYVLDGELTIRFCNEACVDWIGSSASEVLGQRCTYHSGQAIGNAKNLPAHEGLCPPPAVLEGYAVQGIVAAVGTDDLIRRRRSQFIPMGPPKPGVAPLAVIALVEPHDLDENDPAMANGAEVISLERPEPNSDRLHDIVRRFRQEAAGRYGADRLIGQSPAVRLARARIELATSGHGSVLIVGPVGSGRQHIAHAVHYARNSKREGTLIPVECAVLGPDLICSTIQALAANPLGERAKQSTLLLSEVDLLPPEVHAEVAEVIASRSFLPAVVATATTFLDERSPNGQYHAQLAALLSTTVIRLPALADRREDIPLLAQLFLEQTNAQGSKQLGGFTPETLDRLDAYHWPGNVDELAEVVAHAHQAADRRMIEPKNLPLRLRQAADAAARPMREEKSIQLDDFLGHIERELITRALTKAKGNKTKAAHLLGMTRPRLYRRLVQLNLEEEHNHDPSEGEPQ